MPVPGSRGRGGELDRAATTTTMILMAGENTSRMDSWTFPKIGTSGNDRKITKKWPENSEKWLEMAGK